MKLTLNCDGIACDNSISVDIPEWTNRNDEHETGGESSFTFCPHPLCQLQSEWFDAVCPGCVSGFHECELSDRTLYDPRRRYGDKKGLGLTDAHKETIASGVCPFRINGSFILGGGKFEELDLSSRAPTAAGEAILEGFAEYARKYFKSA